MAPQSFFTLPLRRRYLRDDLHVNLTYISQPTANVDLPLAQCAYTAATSLSNGQCQLYPDRPDFSTLDDLNQPSSPWGNRDPIRASHLAFIGLLGVDHLFGLSCAIPNRTNWWLHSALPEVQFSPALLFPALRCASRAIRASVCLFSSRTARRPMSMDPRPEPISRLFVRVQVKLARRDRPTSILMLWSACRTRDELQLPFCALGTNITASGSITASPIKLSSARILFASHIVG
ncbi:hypothetical protein C8Q78DRAFT_1029210 [Trametes maxima]|nr:hypothetical protein C8Q78DRAFT_1029210 [Trametes maxima]